MAGATTELQYYRSENAVVSGGLLTITAKQEFFNGSQYTSARMRTLNKGDWTYGRMEMRAKMPIGQGLWPAFWMLPSDNAYGTWAASGEIDIMEFVGHQPNKTFGTIHYGDVWPGNVFSGNDYFLPSGTFNDDFHVFAIEWDACGIRWFVDGIEYASQSSWWSAGGAYPAPFDQRFHLLLNMAVGGNLPGPPDGTTVFPQELVVDYVRVYQKDMGLGCTVAFDNMEHGNPLANGWFQFGGSSGGGGITGNLFDVPTTSGCNASLEAGFGGSAGFQGGFGRTNPVDLTDMTHFSFWVNPDPGQEYDIEVNLQEDDDGDNSIPGSPNGQDDEFQYTVHVGPAGSDVVAGGGWQKVSIPLTSFADDNSFHYGGNGIFDPVPAGGGGNGQLINVVFSLISTSGSSITFRSDDWKFTREDMFISGRVWDDADVDGVPDGGEVGLNSVTVELLDGAMSTIASTTTSGDGNYTFADLPWGDFTVRVDGQTLPGGMSATYDLDGIGSPNEAAMSLACPDSVENAHFGYTSGNVSVPGFGDDALAFSLGQNVPNPFNGGTRISFSLPEEGPVELSIYDLTGRRVATLVDRRMRAGRHSAEWSGQGTDGRQVAPGIYHYVLSGTEGELSRRMIRLP